MLLDQLPQFDKNLPRRVRRRAGQQQAQLVRGQITDPRGFIRVPIQHGGQQIELRGPFD